VTPRAPDGDVADPAAAAGPDPRSRPIGVFDSGVGGLTVLRAIRRRLPDETTVYLGDTARVPYGPKSPETIRRYAAEAIDFLLGKGVKALVIACNTATARAHGFIRQRVPMPVIGVVGPGARAAARASTRGVIGVIGTRGTIESATYDEAIAEIRRDATVHAAACPLFVALAEEGWTEGEIARLTAEAYLAPLLEEGIDTLVLGCTHYPLLKPLLAGVVGPRVTLIASAEATAEELADRLGRLGLLASTGSREANRYYVTDDAERFQKIASRFLGSPIDHLERVALERGAETS